MINPFRAKVRQKVIHSRLMLTACAPLRPAERQLHEALLQAGLVHLLVAYRLYLRELAFSAGLPMSDHLQTLEQAQKQLPDNQMLQELSASPWLPDLLAAERAVLDPVCDSGAQGRSSEQGLGQLIAVSTQSGLGSLSVRQVDDWLRALDLLIERQRQSSLEY